VPASSWHCNTSTHAGSWQAIATAPLSRCSSQPAAHCSHPCHHAPDHALFAPACPSLQLNVALTNGNSRLRSQEDE
jgi:hypothetical protein